MISQLTILVKGFSEKPQKKVLKNIEKYLLKNKVGYISESAPSVNNKDCTIQIRFDTTVEKYLIGQIKSLSSKKELANHFYIRNITPVLGILTLDKQNIELSIQNKEE